MTRETTETGALEINPNIVLATKSERPTDDGYVEICACLDRAGGWVVGGWSRRSWDEQTSRAVRLRFTGASVTAGATSYFYHRDDLSDGAVGFLLFLRSPRDHAGRLEYMTVAMADTQLRLLPAEALPRADAPAVLRLELERLRQTRGAGRAEALLRLWLERPRFSGQDTVSTVAGGVRLQLEHVLRAPPSGLILIGWLDDPAESIAGLQIRSDDRLLEFDAKSWVRLPRRDVQASLYQEEEAEDDGLDRGFLAYFPDICPHGAAAYLQLELTDGSVAFQPIPAPTSTGLAAVRTILGSFHLRHGMLSRAMDRVVGPAVAALNDHRLRRLPSPDVLCFGSPPTSARCSVIVHLSGRADELDWQLAILSEMAGSALDIIYILDDPNLRQAVEAIAETCVARFGLPFRLLLLSRSAGQALCHNIAAAHAIGDTLCFLSPAAVPDDPAWLDRLLQTLGDADIGAVGARLVPGAGPHADCANVDVETINPACLVIRRSLFREQNEFDARYAIGSFADDDLCRKLRAAGRRCVQRQDVNIRLLDGPPRGQKLWRANLTLFNGWQYERKWPESAP